jgi:small subunit ribosomal protein S11
MAKKKSKTSKGKLYVNATFNNTIVTITDNDGNVLDWVSCGKMGFKGTRKSTPFAATTTLKEAVEKLQNLGIKELEIFLKGPGSGRDAALRVLRGLRGVNINMVSDITPIPHNGPRPPKERRV